MMFMKNINNSPIFGKKYLTVYDIPNNDLPTYIDKWINMTTFNLNYMEMLGVDEYICKFIYDELLRIVDRTYFISDHLIRLYDIQNELAIDLKNIVSNEFMQQVSKKKISHKFRQEYIIAHPYVKQYYAIRNEIYHEFVMMDIENDVNNLIRKYCFEFNELDYTKIIENYHSNVIRLIDSIRDRHLDTYTQVKNIRWRDFIIDSSRDISNDLCYGFLPVILPNISIFAWNDFVNIMIQQ